MRHFREVIGFGAVALLVVAALAAGPRGATTSDGEKTPETRLRRPIAVVPADAGRRLFVANRRAGSLSVLDAERGRVSAEVVIGQQLADLADAGDDRLLAVEEAA